MSLLAVLCWRFPEQLTTRVLRMVYDPEVLRIALGGGVNIHVQAFMTSGSPVRLQTFARSAF